VDPRTNIDQISQLSDIFVKYSVTDYHHKRDYMEMAAQKRYIGRPSHITFREEARRPCCWSVHARSIDWSIINFSNGSVSKIRLFTV